MTQLDDRKVRGRSIRFQSFGLCGEVTAEDPDVLDALSGILPPGWTPAPVPGGVHFHLSAAGEVTCDGRACDIAAHVTDPRAALGLAIQHHVAEHAPGHVFLHAGVVAVEDRAIVVPGPSMSGKTTLVEELVQAGATYLSDEYAAVSPDGRIHPYPRALVLRPGALRFGAVDVRPAQIGSAPVRAGLVVVTRFDRLAEWAPRTMTAGAGAMALLENAVPAQSRPLATLRAVSAVVRGARILTGPRGDAAEVAGKMLALVRESV